MVPEIVAAVVSPFVIHELGHVGAAARYGVKLRWEFSWGDLWGWLKRPRFIWTIEDEAFVADNPLVVRVLAASGFFAEIAAGALFADIGEPVAAAVYALVASVHFLWYALFPQGTHDDFSLLRG